MGKDCSPGCCDKSRTNCSDVCSIECIKSTGCCDPQSVGKGQCRDRLVAGIGEGTCCEKEAEAGEGKSCCAKESQDCEREEKGCQEKNCCGQESPKKDSCCNESESEGNNLDSSEYQKWRKRALIVAVCTVLYNLLEGVVSLVTGSGDESISLLGFGFDSIIEVFSAFVVLWRFQKEDKASEREHLVKKERRATLIIGSLLVLLALTATAGSIYSLVERRTPSSTLAGFVISIGSIFCMCLLYYNKLKISVVLRSSTIEKDAECSFSCIQLSLVLFVSSLIFLISNKIWWIDSASAILISGFIAREGYSAIKGALSEDFDGGCCSAESGPISRRLKARIKKSLVSTKVHLVSDATLSATMFLNAKTTLIAKRTNWEEEAERAAIQTDKDSQQKLPYYESYGSMDKRSSDSGKRD